jgi:diaminohydroxyphosphoribosylaminopyrimidine deaminase/5-amino-6-(5-phosphoribosylamino)uracil reductase
MHALYQLSIQSVLVEGGTFTLQQFIDCGIWEEAKVITNVGINLGSGVKAPGISNSAYLEELVTDQHIQYYQHTSY